MGRRGGGERAWGVQNQWSLKTALPAPPALGAPLAGGPRPQEVEEGLVPARTFRLVAGTKRRMLDCTDLFLSLPTPVTSLPFG